jgi:hypothetical protein
MSTNAEVLLEEADQLIRELRAEGLHVRADEIEATAAWLEKCNGAEPEPVA